MFGVPLILPIWILSTSSRMLQIVIEKCTTYCYTTGGLLNLLTFIWALQRASSLWVRHYTGTVFKLSLIFLSKLDRTASPVFYVFVLYLLLTHIFAICSEASQYQAESPHQNRFSKYGIELNPHAVRCNTFNHDTLLSKITLLCS